MSASKPQFHLARVYDDGSSANPEVVPLARLPWDVQTRRRGFLGTGVAAGIVLAVSRCGGSEATEPASTPEPVAQVSPPDACYGTQTSSANALAFAPDGTLVSGNSDGTVKLWSRGGDPIPKETFGRPAGGGGDHAVTAIAVGAGGSLVAAGDADGTVKLWDLADGHLITVLDRAGGDIAAVAASPDDQILAWASSDGVLLSGPGKDGSPSLDGVEGSVEALAFTPDGALLASGSSDGTLRLSAIPDGALEASLTGHAGAVTAIAVTPDGSLLASGSEDGTVKLWTLPDGEEEATLELPSGAAVNAVAIDADGELLVSGDAAGKSQIWTLPDGQLTTTMDANDGPVRSLAIRGNHEVVAGSSEQLTAWRLPEGTFQSCRIVPRAEPPPEPEPAPVPEPTQTTPTTPPQTAPSPGVQPPMTTPSTPGAGGSICTCNKVCTCIPVSDRRLKTAIRPLVAIAVR